MHLLEQKTAQLAAVRDISRAIAEAQDLETALKLITTRTTEVMKVDSCSIYLYEKEKETLVLAASTGLKPDAIGQMALPVGAGLTGWAVQHGQPVAVANAMADSRFHRLIGSGESRFTSLMAMPLISRGKIIGAVNVQTSPRHDFSDYEIELFGFIADLTATALEKTKLVHAAVVQEIHHRVKNNLQTIAMLLRLQVDQADQLTPQDILHETINRVLSIATVHEILAQAYRTDIEVQRLIQQVTRVVSANMVLGQDVDIQVTGDRVALPSQEATRLALVTNELLQNALEHGLNHAQSGAIHIHLQVQNDHLQLKVSNNGRSLPPDFSLTQHGGLGLQLVRTMIEEDMHGHFSLSALPAGGTEATLSVPLPRSLNELITP